MPKRRLFAYMDGQLIGHFTEMGPARATFKYVDGPNLTPLSLSMPPGGRWGQEIPFNYLDNLLPDNPDTRWGISKTFGTNPDTFSLLSAMGEDVGGAVTLSTSDSLPNRQPTLRYEASDDVIAARIVELRNMPTAPPSPDIPLRFSLAGQQGKFSLAQESGTWFWPTFEMPSTHIFKPESLTLKRAQAAEVACLNLAAESDLPATSAYVALFKGESTFATLRWDRTDARRVHAEDMVQALGLRASDKYQITPRQIIELLKPFGQEWCYIRQMLFNMAVGNTDAHAKNYSVLISGPNVMLAPIYDVLPSFLWPGLSQTMLFPVGSTRYLGVVIENDWAGFADECGLDNDRLMDEMRSTFAFVAERLPDALSGNGFNTGDKDLAAHFVKQSLAPHLRRPSTSS